MLRPGKIVERTYECGFEQHSQGTWEVGGVKYRPFWPRDLPEGWSEPEVRKILNLSLGVMRDFYQKSGEYPRNVYVRGSSKGYLRVIIHQT